MRDEILAAAWEVARSRGLAQLTLRDVADRVGMQPPSLYTHFDSKHAIYDAMFAQAWTQLLDLTVAQPAPDPSRPRQVLRADARLFFDFAVADLPRYQLMNQRTIPGFEPSPEAYAVSVRVMTLYREQLAAIGITRDEDVDLVVALVGGLADAQLANDPGGERWSRLLDRAVDMYADHLNLPTEEN